MGPQAFHTVLSSTLRGTGNGAQQVLRDLTNCGQRERYNEGGDVKEDEGVIGEVLCAVDRDHYRNPQLVQM